MKPNGEPMDRPVVLSIAGHDPSGGAGILADIRVFQAFGVHGMAAVTNLTVQNHGSFQESHWTDPVVLFSQIEIILKSYPVRAVKIGLIRDWALLQGICEMVRTLSPDTILLWDPILKASAGTDFHRDRPDPSLLGRMDFITPNLPEGKQLAGFADDASPWDCGAHLARHAHVLLKGGHGEGPTSLDLLFLKSGTRLPRDPQVPLGPGLSTETLGEISVRAEGPLLRIEGPRRPAGKHGSGCTLSSALAACLALGDPLPTALLKSRHYLDAFLLSGPGRLGFHPSRPR